MMKKVLVFLFAALLSSAADLLPTAMHQSSSLTRPGKDYALFFAVNDYDQWPDLANPVSDVEAIAKDLRDLYGFETEILRNADRTTILNTIEQYRAKTYAADAQLLVFFSGHGEFNEATKQGYFVPKGGLKTDPFGDSYIEYEGLKRRISSLPCNHILLALDACYSGTADEGIALRGEPGKRPGDNSDAERERYISSSLQYKSRMMITSGGKVRTPDKSAFVAKFLEALRSQGGTDGLVNAPELFGYLTTATPKPVISTFGDHEPGGEFLFIRKIIDETVRVQAPAMAPSNTEAADDRAFTKAQERNTVEAYLDYLDIFPKGKHTVDCKTAIAGFKAEPNTSSLGKTSKNHMLNVFKDGFVKVEGGTFMMGCNSELQKTCEYDEKPAHQVTISDFYISPYEVTQKQWTWVMRRNIQSDSFAVQSFLKQQFESGLGNNPSLASRDCDDCPVENVSWDDIQEFLKRINLQNPGANYRLPTEAEWEYAARGGKRSTDHLFSGSDELAMVAWFQGNSDDRTQPVGEKKSNELGLYDMSGNVWEWCSDWDGKYASGNRTNPTGPTSGTYRIVRGGSWNDRESFCRVSYRGSAAPNVRSDGIGFRLVRSD